jgi:catechol 2,3-dioxygenase-like lactoylglutathione lyase family enzyme
MVRVTGFDHLVLVVDDVDRALAWYAELGLQPERVDEWRAGEAPFPSMRVDATTIIDFVPRGGEVVRESDGFGRPRNVDHICLVVEPTDLSSVGSPSTRYGAQGNGTSVYLNDPDGNVVELRHYG